MIQRFLFVCECVSVSGENCLLWIGLIVQGLSFSALHLSHADVRAAYKIVFHDFSSHPAFLLNINIYTYPVLRLQSIRSYKTDTICAYASTAVHKRCIPKSLRETNIFYYMWYNCAWNEIRLVTQMFLRKCHFLTRCLWGLVKCSNA